MSTDNEIIKALEEELGTALIINHRFEESNDTENPDDHRFIALLSRTIKLINRQKAEIGRLNGENKAFGEIIKKQDDEISVLRKDLLKREDLEKSFSKTVKQFDKKLAKTVKLERAEVVKEFAERLKDFDVDTHYSYASIVYELSEEDIDNLVKEMVGAE